MIQEQGTESRERGNKRFFSKALAWRSKRKNLKWLVDVDPFLWADIEFPLGLMQSIIK